MNKLCIVYLGVLLLVLHLSLQVATVTATNTTVKPATDKNGCERAEGLTLLLPLALAAWLLHGWSH